LRRNISTSYDDIARAADVIGAPVTRIAAERAKRKLLGRKKPLNYKDLREINAEVQSRLHDELGTTRFYCMPPGAAEFYNPEAPLFGAEVEARIAKANDDIAEAGKCFATGRYTASVFHLMRAMEAAVQRLSAELGIRNINREWGKLLSDIGGKIENMPKGEKRDDWSQVHANLYHVKQAWRNDTMHPKATYTEEEAREVFEAMKAFMRKLASLLPTDLAEIMA
jgi:HEPN domain-containing protein